jgi:hypothetical protein
MYKFLSLGILVFGLNQISFAQLSDAPPPPAAEVFEDDPSTKLSAEAVEKLKTLADETLELVKKGGEKENLKNLDLKSRELELIFDKESVHWKRASRNAWKVVDKSLNEFVLPFRQSAYKPDVAVAQKFHDAFIKKLTDATKSRH